MTNMYELDGTQLHELPAAHVYLQEVLGFPDYYGRNLDALYDLLTEIGEDTVLWVCFAEEVHPRLAAVLVEAMDANPNLTVILEEGETLTEKM